MSASKFRSDLSDLLETSFSQQLVVVQSLSRVQLFVTAWTCARQASQSITNSRSLPKLMPTESVMPSNHLILCHPVLLLSSIFPNIRVFSNESVLLKFKFKIISVSRRRIWGHLCWTPQRAEKGPSVTVSDRLVWGRGMWPERASGWEREGDLTTCPLPLFTPLAAGGSGASLDDTWGEMGDVMRCHQKALGHPDLLYIIQRWGSVYR